MKCKICQSESAFVAEWHYGDARRAKVECPDCGSIHVRKLSEWELINQREVQPQGIDEVLHDMERGLRYDEQHDRIMLFWRRILFFVGGGIAAVMLWAALR